MDNLNLVRKIAWDFHLTTGLDWEDLFSEASVAYVEAIKTHDPTRSCITTFIWWKVRSHLQNYLKLEKKYRDFTILYDTYFDDPTDNSSDDQLLSTISVNLDHAIDNSALFDSFSKEAAEIADVILENIDLLICQTPDDAKHQIAQMMSEKGWSWKQIWRGLRDLKLAFK
jgi:hypothetical protein